MGECGCGAFSARKIVRVGNRILAVEIYPGCDYCCTGVVVTLHVFTLKDAKAFSLETAEPFEPDEYGHAQIDIPLIGPDDLLHAAKEIGETVGPDGYKNLIDYLSDNSLRLLQIGIHHRRTISEEADHE